jgi:NitT/TauT family transport system substrate-binding protein
MRISAKAAAAAFFVTMSSAAAAYADPLQIRIGWATTPTHMQPIVDALQKKHPELFPNFGKSYIAAGVRFQGSTPQIQALAINELEIAAFGPEALALAVSNAHLDVRVVADVFQDGVPGYATVTYVVRKDSPFHKVEDLKGHTVASNAIGSFGDTAMRVVLHQHGISRRHHGGNQLQQHAGDARRRQGRPHQFGAAASLPAQ